MEEDIYAECVLADLRQVFDAKVGEQVTMTRRLSECSDEQIKFTQWKVLQNHSR